MHQSDPRLIDACLRGDQQAWNELVDRYGRLVYSIPRRYGMDDADAADVFQSVFATLFTKLQELKDQRKLSSWLITTAHRACWKVGKRESKYESFDERFASVSEPAGDAAEQWERQHIVRQGLARLGGLCEELLTALFLHAGQRSYEQIAADVGIKVGSIGPTRARCFEKLRGILEELGYEDSVV